MTTFNLRERIFTLHWEPFEELLAIRCGPGYCLCYDWEDFCINWIQDMSQDEPTLVLAAASALFEHEEDWKFLPHFRVFKAMFDLLWQLRIKLLTSGMTFPTIQNVSNETPES